VKNEKKIRRAEVVIIIAGLRPRYLFRLSPTTGDIILHVFTDR